MGLSFPSFLVLCGLLRAAGQQGAGLAPDARRSRLTPFRPPGGTKLGILEDGGPSGDTGRGAAINS